MYKCMIGSPNSAVLHSHIMPPLRDGYTPTGSAWCMGAKTTGRGCRDSSGFEYGFKNCYDLTLVSGQWYFRDFTYEVINKGYGGIWGWWHDNVVLIPLHKNRKWWHTGLCVLGVGVLEKCLKIDNVILKIYMTDNFHELYYNFAV